VDYFTECPVCGETAMIENDDTNLYDMSCGGCLNLFSHFADSMEEAIKFFEAIKIKKELNNEFI